MTTIIKLKNALADLTDHCSPQYSDAVLKIEAVIAEMEAGEPVAWRCTNWSGSPDDYIYRDADDCAVNAKGEKCGEALFLHPQPKAEPALCPKCSVDYLLDPAQPKAEPVQEPVAWYHGDYGHIELSRVQRVGWKPLYAAAPQAKPLTDDQLAEILVTHLEGNGGYHQFARAIEAAHNIGGEHG